MNNKLFKTVYLKRTLSCLIVAVLVVAGLTGLTKVTERKDSYYRFHSFYQKEDDYDVLFFGTSHVMNGVFPMELWNTYGITSYNMGGSDHKIPSSYWVMRNALDYAHPKVVVIDAMYLNHDGTMNKPEQVHETMDAFPLSRTKIDAINDILSGSGGKLPFIWNFIVYHNRWAELSADDLLPEAPSDKGAVMNTHYSEPRGLVYDDLTSTLPRETTGTEYLRKFIEYCESQGIEVLVTYIPFSALPEEQTNSNTAREISAEYSVNYLGFHDLLNVIDLNTDCADKESHLNPSGARKITDYLGKYLRKHYDVEDHRTDVRYASWNEDYAAYQNEKIDTMRSASNLYELLPQLYQSGFDVSVQTNLDAPLFVDSEISQLWDNATFNDVENAPNEEQGCSFIFSDPQSGDILLESTWDQDGNLISTK